VHTFSKSLAASHAASDLPIWEAVYRQAFQRMECMVDHRADGEHQRAGIDRSIILSNSKQILIDEKVRWKNAATGRVYEDIALEFWSDEGRQVPGWVCKPLRADFIAYAIAPLGKCYLLPVIQLQLAWERMGQEWRRKHHEIRARNDGYTTVSVGVRFDFTPVNDIEPADPWLRDYEAASA
jgi:hypothetical protein